MPGRFALKLKQPGSVTLGHAFLQPGPWGRFKGLPVRRDVAEGLIDQGITVLRYGGSMVNHAGYRWKKMIGPRDRRPPYRGHLVSATPPTAGASWTSWTSARRRAFEYVPAFNMDETPQDMADFIEYAKGPADSAWGRRRAADGHPAALSPQLPGTGQRGTRGREILPPSSRPWPRPSGPRTRRSSWSWATSRMISPSRTRSTFSGAASGITSLAGQQRILQLARQHDREVWFDVHVGTEHPVKSNSSLAGMFSFADALAKIADGARHKVVVFEFNAGNHAQKRALANALAINAIERDGRLPIVTSANGLQPDGQNDNGWDQGLLFLNPSQVWLQPPGYVTQMLSRNYLPQLVKCQVTGARQAGCERQAQRGRQDAGPAGRESRRTSGGGTNPPGGIRSPQAAGGSVGVVGTAGRCQHGR